MHADDDRRRARAARPTDLAISAAGADSLEAAGRPSSVAVGEQRCEDELGALFRLRTCPGYP